MKRSIFFTKLSVASAVLAFACVSCSLCSHKTTRAPSPERFAVLLKEISPEYWHKRPLKEQKQDRMNALLYELNMMNHHFIESNDIDAFQSIVEIDSHIAASFGVFGIMEIANRNYTPRPSSRHLREQSLNTLAGFTSHSSPNVRTAALYALGLMRRHEYKDLVASRFDDKAASNLFFPPIAVSNGYGMSTSVDATAWHTLKKMVGETAAREYFHSVRRESKAKKAIRDQ
jgi:hypothetical protein